MSKTSDGFLHRITHWAERPASRCIRLCSLDPQKNCYLSGDVRSKKAARRILDLLQQLLIRSPSLYINFILDWDDILKIHIKFRLPTVWNHLRLHWLERTGTGKLLPRWLREYCKKDTTLPSLTVSRRALLKTKFFCSSIMMLLVETKVGYLVNYNLAFLGESLFSLFKRIYIQYSKIHSINDETETIRRVYVQARVPKTDHVWGMLITSIIIRLIKLSHSSAISYSSL